MIEDRVKELMNKHGLWRIALQEDGGSWVDCELRRGEVKIVGDTTIIYREISKLEQYLDVLMGVVGMSHAFKVRDGVEFIITTNTNRTTVAYNTEVLMVFDNGSLDIRSSYVDTIASLVSVALMDVIA